MKKPILASFLFVIISLCLLSQYFVKLWPMLLEHRYDIVFLYGFRDRFNFINVFIDNVLVMIGGGLGFLFTSNSSLIAIYFLMAGIYLLLLKRLGGRLNNKRLILFNGLFILIFIKYIALTKNWPLMNILLLLLLLFILWSILGPRLIAKKNSNASHVFRLITFLCMSALLIVLTGDNSQKADLIKRCGYGDIKISTDLNKVFYGNPENEYTMCDDRPEGIETERLHAIEVMNSNDLSANKIIYRGNFGGGYLSIDEGNGNLYFTDRSSKELIVMDLNDYSIKGRIFHSMVDEGDNIVVHDKDHVYILSEDHLKISKMDINAMNVVKTHMIDKDSEGASFTFDHKGFLYVTNHIDHKNNRFFIWVIDPVTLETVKKVPVNGVISRMIFLSKKEELYHNSMKGSFLTSYVGVRDANSLKLKDRIIVPLGLRDIAIDEERGLLFAGNVLTGIVEVIDLSNKKIIKLIKTSNTMLRFLALDTVHQYVYITTWMGIYRFDYR